MLLSNDRAILYRKDLLIHHCVSIILYPSLLQYVSLIGSNVLIMESISTLNYIFREQKWATTLNYYRLGCIVFIRVPICSYYYFYYYPYFLFKSRKYIEDIALKKYVLYLQYGDTAKSLIFLFRIAEHRSLLRFCGFNSLIVHEETRKTQASASHDT